MAKTKTQQEKEDKTQGKKRSSKWPTVRKKFLAENPACAVCGADRGKLEIHHIRPFHEHPELELDPSNFITLCENNRFFNCHRIVGHLDNFRGWNPDVKEDSIEWAKKLKENAERIKK